MIWGMTICPVENDAIRMLRVRFDVLPGIGAVVFDITRSGSRLNTTTTSRLYQRDASIRSLRLVHSEAKMVTEKMYTRLAILENPYRSITMPQRKRPIWVCPAHDRWIWDVELDITREEDDVTFQDWSRGLTPHDSQSHQVLRSMRHLHLGYLSLANYTVHDMDKFFAALPNLKTVSIVLCQGPPVLSGGLAVVPQREQIRDRIRHNTPTVEQCLRHAILSVYTPSVLKAAFLDRPSLWISKALRDLPRETRREVVSPASNAVVHEPHHTLDDLVQQVRREVDLASELRISLEDWRTFFRLRDTLRARRGVEVTLATSLSSMRTFEDGSKYRAMDS